MIQFQARPSPGLIALAVVGALLAVAQEGHAQPSEVAVRGVVEDTEEVTVPMPAGAPSAQARAYSPYAGRQYPTRVLWGDTHLHSANSGDASGPGFALERRLNPRCLDYIKAELNALSGGGGGSSTSTVVTRSTASLTASMARPVTSR